MKLGGLTWWRNNYGSVLQAYALQQKLNSYDDIEYEIICQYGKKVASASNLAEKIQRIGIRKSLKRILWKFGLSKLRARNKKVQDFIDNHLVISDKQYSSQTIFQANNIYDGFVCGSDQIWNPELVDLKSIYWLKFVQPKKIKFSYAPSIGVEFFTDKQKKIIAENLKDFNAISCREEHGTFLINNMMGKSKCTTVLDPVLMVDTSLWDNICAPRKYNFPYIFVYMLRGTKKQRELIEVFAKTVNLKIVTMPFLDPEHIELYDFIYGDIKFWDADPTDFISIIRNAKYVFTDSFHSMVFSCLYHIEFFTFPKIGKAQLNRITDLQDLLCIKERMIAENMDVHKLKNTPDIDWKIVDEIIELKRNISRKYLDDILVSRKGI